MEINSLDPSSSYKRVFNPKTKEQFFFHETELIRTATLMRPSLGNYYMLTVTFFVPEEGGDKVVQMVTNWKCEVEGDSLFSKQEEEIELFFSKLLVR